MNNSKSHFTCIILFICLYWRSIIISYIFVCGWLFVFVYLWIINPLVISNCVEGECIYNVMWLLSMMYSKDDFV